METSVALHMKTIVGPSLL